MDAMHLASRSWTIARCLGWAFLAVASLILLPGFEESDSYRRLFHYWNKFGGNIESFDQMSRWLLIVLPGACFGAAIGAIRGRQFVWTLVGIAVFVVGFLALY